MARVTADLRRQILASPSAKWLEVVVEIEEPGEESAATSATDRSTRIAEQKVAFAKSAEPIEAAIDEVGGQVTGRAWLQRSLKARLPAVAVRALSRRRDIKRLDTPHLIEPE